MPSTSSRQPALDWLMENGPVQLELLLGAVLYHPSAPILITDDDRQYHDASSGARKLLGMPREKIIGRSLDDFAEPDFKPRISELWQAFLQDGEQHGTLRLVGADGELREVEYSAWGNVLPVRHLLVLREAGVRGHDEKSGDTRVARFRPG